MRFEHILQVYWSKGFFFGGKLFYTNKLLFNDIFKHYLIGFQNKFKNLLIQRFELTTFTKYYVHIFYLTNYYEKVHKHVFKTTNIIFSQINNVNANIHDLHKLNIIRQYLIKSYKGYCHALGKPVRGQRTWSNSWNSFKCNNTLRNFINKTRHIKLLQEKSVSSKIDYRSVKKKYTSQKTLKNTVNGKNIKTNAFLSSKAWY